MDYRQRSGELPRTPMAWQHRDVHQDPLEGRYEAYNGSANGSRRPSSMASPAAHRANTPRHHHHGAPSTPASVHSRKARTPDHRRRADPRGSSSERYSQHSSRKMPSRDSRGGSRTPGSGYGKRAGSAYSRSHPSPSSTEETAEETTETDSQIPADRSDYSRQMYPGYAVPISYQAFQPQMMGPIAPPQLIMAPNGSIRSVHSVPMLTAAATPTPTVATAAPTWDGEPCPVHHHQPSIAPLAALYGLAPPTAPPTAVLSLGPSSVPPSVISGATTVRRARSVAEISNGGFSLMAPPPHAVATPHMDRKSFHGSVHQLPPGQAPPPGHVMRAATLPTRLVVSENGAPSHLPIRDPKNRSPLPPKPDRNGGDIGCCSGHFVVIWIILGIITFGILLGIILRFTIA